MTERQRWWCTDAYVDGEVRSEVAITVEAGRITTLEAGVAAQPGDHRLVGLTLPGLANTHSHAFHRALRSRVQAGSGSFWTWRSVMYEAAERLNPDSYFRLARATFAEMALAGMTVVGEFHYLHHRPDGTPYANPNAMGEALLAAAAEAVVRITLLDTVYLHGGLDQGGYQPPEGIQRAFSDRDVETWAGRVDALVAGDGQRIGAAVHSVRAVDPDSVGLAAAECERRGWVLHAHVSEQPAENEACLAVHGCTPVGLLDDRGALGPRFCAVHATHLTDGDVALLGTSGSSVCLCPTTEADLGDGIGPATELGAAGVPLHLGSDSHAIIDHFVEARAVELDQRLRHGRRGFHQADSLLAMATEHGHRALGWDDAGALRPGARADLVTIGSTGVRMAGAPTALGAAAAVFTATAADVRSVVIDGRLVVDEGRHVGLDVAKELSESISALLDSNDDHETRNT